MIPAVVLVLNIMMAYSLPFAPQLTAPDGLMESLLDANEKAATDNVEQWARTSFRTVLFLHVLAAAYAITRIVRENVQQQGAVLFMGFAGVPGMGWVLQGGAVCVYAAVASQASRVRAASGEIVRLDATAGTGYSAIAALNKECQRLSFTVSPVATVVVIGELLIAGSMMLIHASGVVESPVARAGSFVFCFVAIAGALQTLWVLSMLWTASMSLIEAISMLSIADIPSGDSDSDTDSSTDNENELKLSMRQVGVPHRDCHYRSTCMSMCSIES